LTVRRESPPERRTGRFEQEVRLAVLQHEIADLHA
jgi:hypothetical protein